MSQLYPGDLLEGRYRIGAQIAKGGMSTVYIAVDTRLDREVAVKVMDPALATEPAFRTRFEREARAVARLNHPSLVNVFDQGVDRDYVFLVMELVEGGSLRELLKERGPMPPHAAMAVMQPVLTALSVAHSVGMIHRDIKPDNVLISDRHRVKLADFGLVRATNAVGDQTTGQVIGTVGYLSPEQVRGEQLTQASDVYSAGILLFELLTGAVPFREDNPTDTAVARLHRNVPPPSSYIDGVPVEIDGLVLRACHSDPELRFADGEEFLDEVGRVVDELDIPAFNVPAPHDSAVHRALEGTDFGERKSWDHESMATRVVDVPPQEGPATSQTALQNYDPAGYSPYTPPPRNEVTPPPASGTAAAPLPPLHAQPHHPNGPSVPGSPGRSRGPSGLSNAAQQRPAPSRSVPARAPLTNRSPVKTIVWSITIVLLVAAVVVGAWWFSSGRYGTIPDVVGMDTTTAQATVEDAGFTSTLEERYDNTAAAQSVMGTDPPFGDRATRGSRVAVLVSLGTPTVPPIGVAESVTSYTRKLQERTLRLRESSEVYSDDVAAGHIASVSPSGGTEVPVDSTVEVHVSKGPKPVDVPDVRGKEKSSAVRALEKVGLKVKVVEEFSSDEDGGDAIRTEPASGTKVPGKSEVTLVMSNAIKVPDVEGKSLDDAIRILRDKGLIPVEGEPVADSSVDAGDVAQQSPSKDSRIDPNSDTRVTLRVSNAQKVPFVLGKTGESAKRQLQQQGFDVKLNGDPNGRVYRQSPSPGSTAKEGDTIEISTI